MTSAPAPPTSGPSWCNRTRFRTSRRWPSRAARTASSAWTTRTSSARRPAGAVFYALDEVQDLSLLLVPGRATPAVHNAMVRYCEVARGGLVFAVLDSPAGYSATDIVSYVSQEAAIEGLSEHAALYWPRVKVLNPARGVFGNVEQLIVPPSGIIAGVFARNDGARPGGVYEAPAGIEAGRMFGVLGFESKETLEEKKRDVVYPRRINPLTTGPGLPRFIDGSRTLKASGNFPYVAERRGVSFIERSVKAGLQFARHRNNTEGLRAQVRRSIATFLLAQMKNGAFRSQEPAKAFFVDVSDALNPPSVVFAGKLVARIGLATNKPAEFIVLRIAQDTRALEAELASAGL
nr:phage tail sheath subtilisin-like domain-containing protein [Myxococcus sp. AM011]